MSTSINSIPKNTSKNIPSQEKKLIKFNINPIKEKPLQSSYNNFRYEQKVIMNNELDPQIKNIINDPKYSEDKRSKSAFSKKSFREKYESIKIKEPTLREWNKDPTAEVIIHNLEQKIDILTYENFILIKKIKQIENNNKELKLDISQNLMIMKAEQEMNNEKNFNNNINNLKSIKNKNDKINNIKEKDVDLFEEINRLKDENNKLKLSNQNLAENNAELNKIIDNLNNEIKDQKLFQSNNNENINNNDDQNNNINNDNNNNNLININNINNKENNEDEQNNSAFDLNKLILNEEQCKELIEENELLHKKLRDLLLINEDQEKNNTINKNMISISQNIDNSINKKYPDDIKEEKISIKNIQNDDLIKENYDLKKKIKSLNAEMNRMAVENNKKLLIIQDKLNEYEIKQKQNLITNKNRTNDLNEYNNFKKEEQLDQILNETLSVLNRNQDDEESKKMIETIKNIKDLQKKRISQCLIINNKLKSLILENNSLHNQLLSSQKESELKNINSNTLNNTSNNNINNSATNPHICFCGSGNFSVNALKIKDEMIIKYKDKIDENNEMMKLSQNSNISNNRSNDLNFIEKDYYNINTDKIKKEKNEGFEDYLLGKIVNNQKEVLGERAPRFYDNNNNHMAKSMNYDENNNRMNNRYNNYHYRMRLVEDYE